jgi:opacity protein-like surface antigen
MKSFYARGVCLALALVGLTSPAGAQYGGVPSLLPLPPLPMNYPVAQTAATDALYRQGEPSPAPQGTGVAAVSSGDYYDAMKGGYDSCSSVCGSSACGSGCCHNHYVYANALAMTHVKMGGFVTSVDDITGNQRINFCQQEFGNLWNGGFEIGTGWCFGCCCQNAIEMVYWGVYASTRVRTEVDDLDSLIDFTDLDYNGASAQLPYTSAETHQVEYNYNFNSVEANIVGNGCNGGPFGCAMCGGCYGRGGSPWGAGWIAGFRYLNLNEHWMFSADPTGFAINGDPQELNYLVQLNNNLFGFQLGGGLSYCVTDRLTAYSIAKYGIYDNHVTQLQRVYGSLGNADINNGPFAGSDFVVRSDNNVFSQAGQLDFGGRWSATNNWTVNFGYRVLALSGVAVVENNIRQNQFHDVDGVAFLKSYGSFVLHGAYAGATYCW